MRGPFTFSTNEISGLLIDAFDQPPMIMMPYNYEYYTTLIENADFQKAKDLFAYFLDYNTYKKFLEIDIKKFIERYKLEIRPINFKKFDEEIQLINGIYNDAWDKNWGFVPMTTREFAHMGDELKPIIPKESILIAYSQGEPAGFLISIPDFNIALKKTNGRLTPVNILKLLYYKRKINQGRVITLGISHKFRRRAIDVFLISEAIRLNGDKYYKNGCELSWILEDNSVMNKILNNVGLNPYKKYRLYQRSI